MKQLMGIIAGLIIVASAQANILGSEMESEHQILIKEEIVKVCQVNPFSLVQVKSEESVVSVDQGIHDVYFTTQLEMKVKIDQGVFDTYKVLVKSARFDQYDHKNKRWGAYAIESIECSQDL